MGRSATDRTVRSGAGQRDPTPFVRCGPQAGPAQSVSILRSQRDQSAAMLKLLLVIICSASLLSFGHPVATCGVSSCTVVGGTWTLTCTSTACQTQDPPVTCANVHVMNGNQKVRTYCGCGPLSESDCCHVVLTYGQGQTNPSPGVSGTCPPCQLNGTCKLKNPTQGSATSDCEVQPQ